MIDSVDATLATWLNACCPPGTRVSFAPVDRMPSQPPPPKGGGASRRDRAAGSAVVCAVLVDIRADARRQAADLIDVRDATGRLVSREAPVRWYRFTYQVSAVGDSTEQEHAVLGAVLVAGALSPIVPSGCRAGQFLDTELDITLRVAPPTADRDIYGSPPPAASPTTSLQLVVTAPLVPAATAELAPLVRQLVLDTTKAGGHLAEQGTDSERSAVSDRPTPPGRVAHEVKEYVSRSAPKDALSGNRGPDHPKARRTRAR